MPYAQFVFFQPGGELVYTHSAGLEFGGLIHEQTVARRCGERIDDYYLVCGIAFCHLLLRAERGRIPARKPGGEFYVKYIKAFV